MNAGKLTTIVAIDICGYSARALDDEAGAIASVQRLNGRCAKAAEKHGGRIFSRAGDAVMLEFTSVSGGLAAAAELAADPDPPIRVGVHLGEVVEMPDGDLLGHGVNVAARLQSQARRGGVLVSEDARRALRGPLGDHLFERGVLKLEKMDESIGVFELVDQAGPHTHRDGARRSLRGMRFAILGVLSLAVFGVVAWLAQPMFARAPARVAVFSLNSANDDDTRRLGAGLADDITLALTAIGVETVARSETVSGTHAERMRRARALGASLAIDGSVERNGQAVRVIVEIVRVADRTRLWSQAFDGDADSLDALRQRAAERSGDVLACGVNVVRRQQQERRIASEMFSAFLRACELRPEPHRMLEMHDALTHVVEEAPDFAYARGLLALSAALASQSAPETVRAELRREAHTEAERARRSDATVGESYIALEQLEPITNWMARERILREALTRNELDGTLNNFYSNLLGQVGRLNEAVTAARRGQSLDPLSAPKRRALAHFLFLSGDLEGSDAIIDAMAPAYRDDSRMWRARIRNAFWSGHYDAALRMLREPGSEAQTPRAQACWRASADALQRRSSWESGIAAVLKCHHDGDLPETQVLMLLTALGDNDAVFSILASRPRDEGPPDVVFSSIMAPVRADTRFMPLLRDLGLLRYWRDSGHWPDFCDDPQLPYRCQAVAQRLL